MTQNERRSLPIWRKLLVLILTLFIFAAQISIFALMFEINYSSINWVIYAIIEVIAFILVVHIIHKPILTSYKLTWSILILIVPLPFTFLYYLTHNGRRLPRYKQKKINEVLARYHQEENHVIDELSAIDSEAARQARVIYSNNQFPLYKNTKYTFMADARDKFDDVLKEMKNAEKYIFIESFILSDGFLLSTLLPLLENKGKQGVEIKIIYDDLGSKMTLKNKTIKRITMIPNCQIVNYNPLGLSINPAYNYRDHRKIIIIDGKIAYCGGDNLADEYIHKKERFGFWRDNCGKFEGDAVTSFVALFVETWYMSTKEILPLEYYATHYQIPSEGYVMPFGDGPSIVNNIGYDTFHSLIAGANKTLYISTPYLVIDDAMIESIALAARSGVDVRILMPGIPDKKSAFYLAKLHYRDILLAGGKIYEYSKGFNHAKNIMVDNRYAFIGTINMDFRSLFLHYECGALILLNPEIEKMQNDFIKACNESKQITYEDWKKRPWWQKIIAYIFYLFAPMF